MPRHHKAKLGTGTRFHTLVSKIRRQGGARNPAAVAAAIGRKKYGKGRMQRMAAHGKRHR